MRTFVRVVLITMLIALIAVSSGSLTLGQAQAAPLSGTYCGALGEYTSWHLTNGKWKQVLWVWNNGRSVPYPAVFFVYYNGQLVENSQKGVQTSGDPQVEQYNGWVGYFISTTWASIRPGWDDDWRWNAQGCIAN